MTTAQHYLRNEPVRILQSAGRGQVLIEKPNGMTLIVYRRGLAVHPAKTGTVTLSGLKIDSTRGTDGAR